MCADTKTLRVDRAVRLGSLGAALSQPEHLCENGAALSGQRAEGGEKGRRQACLQRVKKTLLKELQYHEVTVKNQCM